MAAEQTVVLHVVQPAINHLTPEVSASPFKRDVPVMGLKTPKQNASLCIVQSWLHRFKARKVTSRDPCSSLLAMRSYLAHCV